MLSPHTGQQSSERLQELSKYRFTDEFPFTGTLHALGCRGHYRILIKMLMFKLFVKSLNQHLSCIFRSSFCSFTWLLKWAFFFFFPEAQWKKMQAKESVFEFLLKDFFETVLSTEVSGLEIVSSTTRAAGDESPVSNQGGYLGGIIPGNLHRSHLLGRGLDRDREIVWHPKHWGSLRGGEQGKDKQQVDFCHIIKPSHVAKRLWDQILSQKRTEIGRNCKVNKTPLIFQ